ncbi:MAG: helix-turn-helix domain-containing protein [Streptomyces sp.]|uniref:helix-turn-helix domain-containing protein n=1 Tax=Streptomyces sp. TaxID=1931 RepID=UPI003D6C3B36
MTHVRHRHESHFTVVGNHLAQHPTLSATAIGIAVRIQSLPDGARVGVKALAAHFRESEQRIAAALRDLEAAGYLQRRTERAAGQRIVTRTTWHECPGSPASSGGPRPAGHRRGRDGEAGPEHRGASPAKQGDVICGPRGKGSATPTAARPVNHTVPDRPDRDGPAPTRTAAILLTGLRAVDPRLLLSPRDIARLTPAVSTWLDRGVPPAQVARTLSATLPPGDIRWPARLLAHRLTEWLPPTLPPRPPAPTIVPLQTCDGCDRAFRAPTPGHCRDCRGAPASS